MIIEKFSSRKHKSHKIKIVVDRQEAKVLLEIMQAAKFPIAEPSFKPVVMAVNIISGLNKILGIKKVPSVPVMGIGHDTPIDYIESPDRE